MTGNEQTYRTAIALEQLTLACAQLSREGIDITATSTDATALPEIHVNRPPADVDVYAKNQTNGRTVCRAHYRGCLLVWTETSTREIAA